MLWDIAVTVLHRVRSTTTIINTKTVSLLKEKREDTKADMDMSPTKLTANQKWTSRWVSIKTVNRIAFACGREKVVLRALMSILKMISTMTIDTKTTKTKKKVKTQWKFNSSKWAVFRIRQALIKKIPVHLNLILSKILATGTIEMSINMALILVCPENSLKFKFLEKVSIMEETIKCHTIHFIMGQIRFGRPQTKVGAIELFQKSKIVFWIRVPISISSTRWQLR